MDPLAQAAERTHLLCSSVLFVLLGKQSHEEIRDSPMLSATEQVK